MEGIKKAMNERNLNEGQWEDRKQWSLGVGHCRKNVLKPVYIYIHTYTRLLFTNYRKHLYENIIYQKLFCVRFKNDPLQTSVAVG
jgi:hypothetical protein